MSIYSNGILLFRFKDERLEVMLVHPGGPLWAKKDNGVWSIPKGLAEEHETPLDTAKREFREETGFEVDGEFIDLGELKQSGKKIVHVWALEKDLDISGAVSNTFTFEWPKNSGKIHEYPEVDKAGWFDIELARIKILKGQVGFLDRLMEAINFSYKEEHHKEGHHKEEHHKEEHHKEEHHKEEHHKEEHPDREKKYRQTTLF